MVPSILTRRLICVLVGISFFAAAPPVRAADDLRDHYGTRSMEAAQKISVAIKLTEEQKPTEAKIEIDAALKIDPKCPMAHFWKAEIEKDLGNLDQCLASYKQCIAVGTDESFPLTCTAMTNLGLVYASLKELDQAEHWLSRAIIADIDNANDEQAKAYRNLAIALHVQGQDLAAALAAIEGHRLDEKRIPQAMVEDLLNHSGGHEAARVLTLDDPSVPQPKMEPRATPTKLTKATPGGAVIKNHVNRLLPDPQGRYIVAIVQDAASYYLIRPGSPPTVQELPAPAPLSTASLAGGRLFLVAKSPPKLCEVVPETGAAVKTWDMGGVGTESLVVFPSQNAAFFASRGFIHRLDLASGATVKTEMSGQILAGEPTERFLYARFKNEHVADNSTTVIIDGRPIFIQEPLTDWNQTALLKYYVAPKKLLSAGLRKNIAANGYDVAVSPDGQWVAIPGGGGWRPQGENGSYCVPVFSAGDVGRLQTKIDDGARSVSFNAVTGQVALVGDGDFRIVHLTASKPDAKIEGKFGGVSAWSGDGKMFAIANADKGVTVFDNAISPEEAKIAQTWWKAYQPPKAAVLAKPAVAVAALKTFNPQIAPAAAEKSLAMAILAGASARPIGWRQHPAYIANADSVAAVDEWGAKEGQAGIRIYQLRKAIEKDTACVPLKFYLAEAMREGNQQAAAVEQYLAVIRADAGQTDVSVLALNHLAALYQAVGDKDIEALACASAAMSLDRANPDAIGMSAALARKVGFVAEAKALEKR